MIEKTEDGSKVVKLDLVDRLREAKSTVNELIIKLLAIRSRDAVTPILAVEGVDDVAFYQTLGRRVSDAFCAEFLVCGGKPRALRLLVKLREIKGSEFGSVNFIFDKDFDGLKGEAAGNETYVLPVYSIENLMTERSVLRELLEGEFRCSSDSTGDELETVMNWYDQRFTEYSDAIRPANRLMFFARRKNVWTTGTENTLSKYLNVQADFVVPICDFDQVSNLVGFREPPSELDVCEFDEEFGKLNASHEWRGKFHYEFFRKILTILKQDRCNSDPSLFTKRINVSFEPGKDLFRMLASIVQIPGCLRTFLSSI